MDNTAGRTGAMTFPHEVLHYIIPLLGPLELNASQGVCRGWRTEVNHRVKALKTVTVKTLEELQGILSALQDQPSSREVITLELSIEEEDLDPYPVLDIFTILRSISWICLGKVVIGGRYSKVEQGKLLNILQRFQNLVNLEFCRDFRMTDSEFFHFRCIDEAGRVTAPSFPTLKVFKMKKYELSLSSILTACPNLTNLTLRKFRGPYSSEGIDASRLKRLYLASIDIPSLKQLRALNLNLRTFHGIIGPDSWDRRNPPQGERGQRHAGAGAFILVLSHFLQNLASNLVRLNLRLNLKDVELTLFPIVFPKLKSLCTNIKLASNVNHILDSIPKVQDLHFLSSQEEMVLGRHPMISPFLYHGIARIHPTIDYFEIGYEIKPVELSVFGFSFSKLTSLSLNVASHGLLRTVWSQLTRLTYLDIYETRATDAKAKGALLRDSDFILTALGSDLDGPYIENMRMLKHLNISFVSSDDPPLITDSILTDGICHIATQLDELTIDGVQFSEEALYQLRLYMTSIPNPHPKCHDFVRKTD